MAAQIVLYFAHPRFFCKRFAHERGGFLDIFGGDRLS